MRISDWSSDVCSSDLWVAALYGPLWFWYYLLLLLLHGSRVQSGRDCGKSEAQRGLHSGYSSRQEYREISGFRADPHHRDRCSLRSEEHTSELQSLMRISYAVFCLKKKTKTTSINNQN